MIELPDVNVLIALFDLKHIHHEKAQAWFASVSQGWATCPITENGFLRIVSNPGYAGLYLSVVELASGLRTLIAVAPENHYFLSDDVSLSDRSRFDLSKVRGYRQLTDLCLLGLCQKHKATLVTFDGGIQSTIQATVTPRSNLVRLLVP